jgi:hypothetical protein
MRKILFSSFFVSIFMHVLLYCLARLKHVGQNWA